MIEPRRADTLQDFTPVLEGGRMMILRCLADGLYLAEVGSPTLGVLMIEPNREVIAVLPDPPSPPVLRVPADEPEAIMTFARAGFTVELMS